MKLAAAYIRVSTDDQIELSPDSQLKQIREYAKRNDMIVPEEFIFIDEGISGKNASKRPAFNQMIGIAKTKPKPFDAILLWKFSRFARNREDSVVYKSMLRKQLGIEVISITENLGDDKMSILIEAMIEAMDEYYSINLAEEVRRGMKEKVQRGKPVSYAPLGYRMKDKEYVIDEEKSEIVKMIFREFLNGTPYREIATKLNALGLRTRFGNKFENRTVQYILCNPVYIGKIRWNENETKERYNNSETAYICDGTHPSIISREDFEKVQKKMEEIQSKHIKYRRSSSDSSYLLKSLVRCSTCGSTLSRSISNSLQCNAYAKGACSVSHSVVMHKINSLVLNVIEATLRTGNFELIQRTPLYVEENSKIIEAQIKQEERKLQKIKEAYYSGVDTIEEYRNNKKTISETIEKLKKQLPKTPKANSKKEFIKKHLPMIKTLKDESISESERNALLLSFVDRIIYDKATEHIEIFFYQ